MDIHTLRFRRGFTLLEMLFTMTIGAILTSTAIPAFHELLQRNRITTEINTFVGQLHYTRSEAIKRGVRAVMCRSSDGENCEITAGWEEGWIIFADFNANRELDGRDELLFVEKGEENGITITSGQRRRIVFQNTGQSPGSNGTYVFCEPDYPEYAKAVIISNTGRPRISDVRPDGSDLACGNG